MSRRTQRVNALIREELSELLREDVHDRGVGGLVTITHVDVSPDLRRAQAYVSVLGSEDDRNGTMQALERARPFLRRELAQRLRLRYAPELDFVDDRGMEDAQRITDIMRRNAEERGETL
jgi:ribosome-binding factor A